MDRFNDEWKRIYTAKLSMTSIQSIAKYFIGETLSTHLMNEMAQHVRDEISKIVAEAGKYARRTRSPMVKMEHLLFALEKHDIDLDILHFNYTLSERNKGQKEKRPYLLPKMLKFRTPVPEQSSENEYECENENENENESEDDKENEIEGFSTLPKLRDLSDITSESDSWMRYEYVLLMNNNELRPTVEQEELYILLTESCLGTSEQARRVALKQLRRDASLQPIMSRLTLFIGEAVKVNVVQQNFALLSYLMRMVYSLLCNTQLQLHNYLHILIPSVISCVVSRQLCCFPAVQNHWALREYAANIMADFVKKFNCYAKDILPRVINIYKRGLESPNLTTVYGSLIGLSNIGRYAVRNYVIPQILRISALVEPHITKEASDNDLNKQASKFIRHRLLKMCSPILKNLRKPPDVFEEYSKMYGFLGSQLYDAVVLQRIMDAVVKEVNEGELSHKLNKLYSS